MRKRNLITLILACFSICTDSKYCRDNVNMCDECDEGVTSFYCSTCKPSTPRVNNENTRCTIHD